MTRRGGRAITITFALAIAALACAGEGPDDAALVAEKDLVARYPLDGAASETTGSGPDGEMNGPVPTEGRHGGVEGALAFDGEDDHVAVPLDIGPERHPELTITAWARAESAEPIRQVVSHDDGGFDRSVGIDDRGGVDGWSAFAGTGSVLGGAPVEVGRWTFLAVVYDAPADTVRLHVVDRVFTTAGHTGEGLERLRIGSNPTHDEFFHGAIDEVRFYGRALTREEVAEIRAGS